MADPVLGPCCWVVENWVDDVNESGIRVKRCGTCSVVMMEVLPNGKAHMPRHVAASIEALERGSA